MTVIIIQVLAQCSFKTGLSLGSYRKLSTKIAKLILEKPCVYITFYGKEPVQGQII